MIKESDRKEITDISNEIAVLENIIAGLQDRAFKIAEPYVEIDHKELLEILPSGAATFKVRQIIQFRQQQHTKDEIIAWVDQPDEEFSKLTTSQFVSKLQEFFVACHAVGLDFLDFFFGLKGKPLSEQAPKVERILKFYDEACKRENVSPISFERESNEPANTIAATE